MRNGMEWEQCFPEICNSLFRISVSYGAETKWGTGFPVGKYKKPDKLALVLATAKHLLSFSKSDTVEWRVEQFDWQGKLNRGFSFKSNTEMTGKSPIRVHTEFDIGTVFMPNLEGIDKYKPLRTIPSSQAIIPGAKVGWAGFPEMTRYKTLSEQPCYFEGVVSAVVSRGDRLYYIIDGHSELGVSGGPVWCWNDEESNYDVIGIVSQYVIPKDLKFPGLCVFESINPLMAYLATSKELEMNPTAEQECRWGSKPTAMK
jgi:hypothetical protein